jgi:tetratricopeptide (TPR) repeat protein
MMQTSETIDENGLQDLVARAEEHAAQRDFVAARVCYEVVLPKLRPDHPAMVRTLVGYAWTLHALGDHAGALCQHEAALNTQLSISSETYPAICTIRQGIGATLIALGQFEAALAQYRDVLSIQRDLLDRWHPDLAATLNILGETSARLNAYEEARCYQDEALAILRVLHPPGAPQIAAALTNLGVSLFRLDVHPQAEACLHEALAIDPDLLLAAENLIHIHYQQGRKAEGRVLAAQKYRRQSFVVQMPPVRPIGTLLVLWSLDGNIPKHHLLGRLPMTMIDWHIQYASEEHERHLPPYDLAFTLIGDADQGSAALERAARFRDRCGVRLLNDPANVQRTRRDLIPGLLAGVDDLIIPRVIRTTGVMLRDPGQPLLLAQAGISLPLIFRRAGLHGGESAQLIATEETLARACALIGDDDAMYVMAFHDYASHDGYYRKYRVIFVDRVPYAYHLAISRHWLVHYFSAEMEAHPWKPTEELAFLADAPAMLGPRAFAVIETIGQSMDLDYCGIDFTVLPDGRVLLFEANATMLVHPEDEHNILAGKNPYIDRIFTAFDQLVRRSLPRAHPG